VVRLVKLGLFAFEEAFQEVPIIPPSAVLAVVARRRLKQLAYLFVWKHSVRFTHIRRHLVTQERSFVQLERVCSTGIHVY
jgi:hypothetical protein